MDATSELLSHQTYTLDGTTIFNKRSTAFNCWAGISCRVPQRRLRM